ncbi:MAG TPA: hypothetical protein PKK36_11140, partial [Kiritimatiellia bacterium]|nr:hypothetical protein [Kiritimatiellia bacterium]
AGNLHMRPEQFPELIELVPVSCRNQKFHAAENIRIRGRTPDKRRPLPRRILSKLRVFAEMGVNCPCLGRSVRYACRELGRKEAALLPPLQETLLNQTLRTVG